MKVPQRLLAILSKARPSGTRATAYNKNVGANQILLRDTIMKLLGERGVSYIMDTYGNVRAHIEGNDAVAFTAHLDTVHTVDMDLTLYSSTPIQGTGDVIISARNSLGKPAVLGADDGAGVYLLLEMIDAKVEGYYYFFLDEEVGRLGSKAHLTWALANKSDSALQTIKSMVSFDRRLPEGTSTGDVIVTQKGTQCTSKEFTEDLKAKFKELGMTMQDGIGSYTDSASFIYHIPECTNVSVGYDHEHTSDEILNLTYLMKLRDVVLKLDWSNLKPRAKPITEVKVAPVSASVPVYQRPNMTKEDLLAVLDIITRAATALQDNVHITDDVIELAESDNHTQLTRDEVRAYELYQVTNDLFDAIEMLPPEADLKPTPVRTTSPAWANNYHVDTLY